MNSHESLTSSDSSSEDDEWYIVREHGGTWGRPADPVHDYHGPIEEKSIEDIARDEHGGSMGVPASQLPYHGPIIEKSTEEVVRSEHGGPMGVPEDTNERYGTNDREVLNTLNELRRANWVADLDQKVAVLPEKSLSELIALRYKNTANDLDDRWGNKKSLSENLSFDLAIIAQTVRSGKEIPDMNAAQYVGQEDERDLSGILDAYQEKITKSRKGDIELLDAHTEKPIINPKTNSPFTASEAIASIKQEITTQNQKESSAE